MKCYPMLVVQDVPASSRWYQDLLGVTSAHGGDEFEMLMAGKDLILTLHHRDVDEHPVIADPSDETPGRGVLLYFSVEDVQAFYDRARAMGADVVDEPHDNPKAHAVEFSLRDPDGYAMTVSQWAG
ncbi:MAG: VOC family protein [Gemmatimonadetes bacterium]|nr:VOC family protein [Gemmatimonadota bacterium]NNF12588.1 VOC family protein [Gemmatimonadota bacterium]